MIYPFKTCIEQTNRDFRTWTPISRPLQPDLGRKHIIESESEVRISYFWAPASNNYGKRIYKKYNKSLILPLYSLNQACSGTRMKRMNHPIHPGAEGN